MSESMSKEGFALFYRSAVQEAAAGAIIGATGIEADDVEMTVWEALYSRFDYYSSMEPNAVHWLIRRKANEAVAKERRDLEHFRGCFVYTTSFVRTVLDEAVWVELDGVPDIDARVDVMTAYAGLNVKQRTSLFKRFGLRDELTGAEKKMANRAIIRIADVLNANVDIHEEELEFIA